MPHQADNDLILLGEQFEKIVREELGVIRRWRDETACLLDEEIEQRATWPEDQEKWTRSDAAAYCKVREQVEREMEIGAAFNRAFYAEEACYQKLEPLYHQITSLSAETPEGRVLQMRVIATQLGFECDELWG